MTRVQLQPGTSVVPGSSRQAVEPRPQQPEARTTMCGRCGLYLSVPRDDARFVSCVLCHYRTRVHRRPSGLEDFFKGLIYSLMSPPEPPPSSSEDWLPASYLRVRGRKRALLVGIGYTGTRHEIEGQDPVNDVKHMTYLLRQKFGFPSDSILALTEEEKDPICVPTMKNLLLAMRWLVRGCDTGDAMSLVFHFSGHALNQSLCPVDFQQGGGLIPDSKINEIIVRPLGPGVKLHAFVDNDGYLGLDLPYICSLSRTGYWGWENQNQQKETPKGTNGGLAISISGSGYAASVGALTFGLIDALESEPGTTYGRLMQAMEAKILMEPQLRTSEPFDVYHKPFLL